MKFEKWQALGNDYVIIESRELEFELTEARIQKLCAPHFGLGSDGIVLVSATDTPGFVANLRIFNPDGSEAELSGNGVREAVLYLRNNGWTESQQFSVETAAGEIRPTITSATTCTVDMGRARLKSDDFPSGGEDGRGQLEADGRSWSFQHVKIGNPQCSIRVADEAELKALDLPAIGGGIEKHALFPNRTNVSWYTPLADNKIRARIFERGVGEDLASGTGGTGAAVAHVLAGGESPVTVILDGGELEVEVEEDLHINLSGWAKPVYTGTLSKELIEELHATV
ncbi:MAG: diaminopimelate epimerase [Solirubrobacterales bacterium]|nr:diaminopimelate epimerase [Solirubrobacterales bacterium]